MRMKYQREYWSKWERVKDPYLRQRKAWKIQAVLEEAVPGIAHWNGWALDIGCSTGRITEHFAQLWPDWHVIGVDIDEDALHWATAHRHYAYFCFGDAMRLPFPNDKYNPLFETHNPAKPFVKSTMKPDSRNKTERWRSIEQFDSQ